jgi:peroxiredoxin
MLKVGDKFPTTTLEGVLGGEAKTFDLGAPGKNQVLVFYPFAFTPV